MLYRQIPVLLYSLSYRFGEVESIKLTQSQYALLRDLLESCYKQNQQPELSTLIKRIDRRVKEDGDYHLWHAEFNFISTQLMTAMKDNGFCRQDDDPYSSQAILKRQTERLDNSRSRKSRKTDPLPIFSSMKSAVNRFIHN